MTKNNKAKINIMVVAHRPAFIVENPLLKSIQVGTNSNNKIENMDFYDDDGDNISEKNKSYCELTATYWAWKNLESDYYGLFHYRRYLSFAKNQDDRSGVAYRNVSSALPDINLDPEYMKEVINEYDLVIPKKEDTRSSTNNSSIYEQYEKEHYIKDLDFCLDYIRGKYPDVSKHIKSLDRQDGYFCNMFIMNKELYNEYCNFLFDTLSAFDEHTDISEYNIQQHRVDGFIAERLTNIFIHYIQSVNKYKIKEMQIAYFENTDPEVKLKPVSTKNNIPIVLAANNFYIPYVSTIIRSIANHSSSNNTYDINVFHRDIDENNALLIRKEFEEFNNISIRFCDLSFRYDEYKDLFTRGHFSLETYFRLFIQDTMVEYDKVLYLDSDMIVEYDVAELYKTDIDGYLLAAVVDPDTAGLYNGFESQKKHYMDEILKISKPFEYFQAGVILFNLDKMRGILNVKDMLKLASSYDWELLDQDVLNYIAQGDVKFVDMSWNVMYNWGGIRIPRIISLAPIGHYIGYMKSRKSPKIIHYAGPDKPWHNPECDYASNFWAVARNSVFYEIILMRMSEYRSKNIASNSSERIGVIRRGIYRGRYIADIVAPVGSYRRMPITLTSRGIKKIIYRKK